jgi:hypothetical protein
MRRSIAGLVAAFVLVACGGDSTGSGDTTGTVPAVGETASSSASTPPSSDASVTPTTSANQQTPPYGSSLPPVKSGVPIDPTRPLVTDAVADLAGRLGIGTDEVAVVDALAVTWPDSSLGCPQPGMMYSQVLTKGTLVVLEAGGKRYEYHGGKPLFLCE